MKHLPLQLSLCNENDSKIVCEENRIKYIANNIDKNIVMKFNLENIFKIKDFPNEKRCDYLVLNCDKRNAYFIELKGRNIKCIIDQLENSIKLCKDDLQGYSTNLRFVYTKASTHDIYSSEFLKFKDKYSKKIKYHSVVLEEDI